MSVNPIPDGYHTITPYLLVEDADGLIEFLKEAFDAQERGIHKRPDGKIMHAEVTIGDSIVMIAEAAEQWDPMACMLHLYVEDVDAAYKRALNAGATSLREPRDEFYGDRSGGVLDRFGNQWWIATRVEDVSPEEMKRRQEALDSQRA